MRWLAVIALVLLVPAAAGEDRSTINVGSDFTLTFDGVSTAPQDLALFLRQQVDSDDDGTVSLSEAAAFDADIVPRMEEGMAEANKRVTFLDGNAALSAKAELTFTGLTGAVDSEEPLTSTVHQVIRVQPGPGPVHILESKAMSNQDQDGVPTQVVLTAPSGYWISAATYPGATIDQAGRTATWADGPNVGGTITFTPSDTTTKASPVGAVAGISILAAAAISIGRRAP